MSNCLRKLFKNRSIITKFAFDRYTCVDSKFVACCCTSAQKWTAFPVNTGDDRRVYLQPFINHIHPSSFLVIHHRNFSTAKEPDNKNAAQSLEEDDMKKLGLFKRFKKMYRDYWYVLIPVHLVTSAVWVAVFYYLAKSGVDVVALLERMGATESILSFVRNSSTGYFAITYALYKIATPARYAVTLGGTTVSINYLKQWGYIKPIPSKTELKEMFDEKRGNLREKTESFFKNRRKD